MAANRSLPDRSPERRLSETDTSTDNCADDLHPRPDTRIATLKKRSDFLRANRGWRFVSPGFILLIHRRNDGDDAKRAGYTVTKKTGNAVTRNRIKRRLRALVQQVLPDQGAAGADHIFIGRSDGAERDWSAMLTDLENGLKRYADGKPGRGSSNRRGKPRAKSGKRPHK